MKKVTEYLFDTVLPCFVKKWQKKYATLVIAYLKRSFEEKTGSSFIEITSLGFKAIQDHNEKFKIERSQWWQKLFIEIILTSIISSISSIIVAYLTLKLFNK